jgi:phosphatidylglycerophosphate synthase
MEHVREHRSVLARGEKRLLIWIAERMPRWVNSDHLTWLALLSMLLAGTGYWLLRWETRAVGLVVAALALNWFGDSLDGTLARVRRVERPRYGYYVDHVLDIVGTTLLIGGLALSGYMTPVIALSVLVAYLLVTGEVFLATTTRGVFKMSSFGVGPTELRILLAIGTLALPGNPHVSFGSFGRLPLFDMGGLVAIPGLAVALLSSVWRNSNALATLEPRPASMNHECSNMNSLRSLGNSLPWAHHTASPRTLVPRMAAASRRKRATRSSSAAPARTT